MKDFLTLVTFLKKKSYLESCGQWQIFFSPSLETTESTLYVFSIPKTSNEVKYKVYSFGLYEVPVLNNHFFSCVL